MILSLIALSVASARAGLFPLVLAGIAVVLLLMVSASRRMRRKKPQNPANDQVVCHDCHLLIPDDRYNCAACGWPHVPERESHSKEIH